MKEMKIAWSNIKRRKSSAITLSTMSGLAVIMLIISLSLLMGVGSLVETRIQALNTADISFAINSNAWSNDIEELIQNAEGMIEYETKPAVLGEVTFIQNGRENNAIMMFTSFPQNQNLNTVTILDRLTTTPQNPITLPLAYRISGFSSGDTLTVSSLGFTKSFTIYGFYETILFGLPAMHQAFINQTAFDVVAEDYSLFSVYTTSMSFDTTHNAEQFFFNRILLRHEHTMQHGMTLGNVRMNLTSFPIIMAAILSLVAIIVVFISLIVARFNIINSLEQDMKIVGALKGIGYNSKQLIRAKILQYLLIVLLGSLVGVILAIPIMGAVGNIVASTTGLIWAGLSMLLPTIISMVAVVGIITLATYFVARRTKRITPIVALRSGIETHSFKKSATNLTKTKMPLNMTMAVKMFRSNFKRNIAVFITLSLFSFMAVLGFTAHYNFVVDTSAYRAMVGMEPAHVRLITPNADFAKENFGEFESRDNVRKTLEFDFITMHMSESQQLRFMVFNDINDRLVNTIIRGRQPIESNEISLLSPTASWLGVGVGDSIEVQHINGNRATFLITGITQGWGADGFMTTAGVRRVEENIVLQNIYFYLYDYNDDAIAAFMNGLVEDFGRDMTAINYVEQSEIFFRTMEQPINIAMIFIMVITIFVIVLVLFLMVNTIINRHKQEAGMLKAIGFTSGQLMIQMLLSFLPIILGGVIFGSVLGLLLTNPLLGVMFSGLGVAQASFAIVPALAALGGGMITAAAAATISLVGLKYKKATAHSLIAKN